MPIIKRSTVNSQVNTKLKNQRKQIIEEERIRELKESLMLFYDKLMEKYQMIQKNEDNNDEKLVYVDRNEIDTFTKEYAETKPKGF